MIIHELGQYVGGDYVRRGILSVASTGQTAGEGTGQLGSATPRRDPVMQI